MKPRLFVLMLAAFALVIVLGIGGMVGFFLLAVFGDSMHQNTQTQQVLQPIDLSATQTQYLTFLSTYYAAHGSWDGVRPQLHSAAFDEGPTLLTYVVLDANGKIVASSQFGPPASQAALATAASVPIEVDGRQVGTFALNASRTTFSDDLRRPMRFAQGLLSGGLGLAAVLLGLATFFSRRISQPLQRLTWATRTMAAGDMTVRVQGHPIREIDELARSFNAMADSLTAADQQRRQLTADVAHELRTPLSIIKGRLEGIQDGVYQPTPDQVSGLLAETAQLERMIEDLRVLAMADAGQLPLYLGPMDPADLLYDIADSFEPEANERGVTITVQADEALPELFADPQRIAQVTSNLVSNALRYTPLGGEVTLSVAHNPPSVPKRELVANPPIQAATTQSLLFTVADTGMGIAPADLPHIFDRFWRADRARTRSSGGAGLGLAIARRIVEAHGGTMFASSSPGKGTSISFTLPVEGTS